MSYEMSPAWTRESGERQPAIDALPELTASGPTVVRTAPTRHPPVPQRPLPDYRHRRCMNINAFYGVAAAFVSLYPNPPRFINNPPNRWTVYKVFFYIFGVIYSIANIIIPVSLDTFKLINEITYDARPMRILLALVVPPTRAFFIIVPTFGPLIFTTPLRRAAYNHRCDSWPAQVVLVGRRYRAKRLGTALFVTAGDSRPLFSFDLDRPVNDRARFQLRRLESPEETIEPQYIPAVRETVYDFVNLRVNGTCGIDATPCLSGNFEVDRLTMDLKFNLTAGSAEVHSRAQSSDTSWTWTDGHPALIYKTLEDDGSLGSTVLQTVVARVNDCTRLKTCLAGSKAEGSGGVFGPDVLAPLGLLLEMQGKHARGCWNT